MQLVVAVLVVGFLRLGVVYAGVNDFVINNFDAKYTLSNVDMQGSLTVTETIDITFSDNNHGIFRAIPNSYKDNSLDIRNITVSSQTGAPPQFTQSTSNDNIVLKIGDPNRMVTGKQNYTISYTLSNVIAFYDNYDEFYWDINGTEWLQQAEKVSMTLTYPEGAKVSSTNIPVCFTGAYGGTEKYCSISLDSPGLVTAKTTARLSAGQTMSVVVGFEKGYFTPVSAKEKLANLSLILAETFGIPLVLGTFAFRRWRTHGRDPKGGGIIVAQYDSPKDLLAAEVGAIVDFKVDQKDITATIVDLAIKGYITIIEKTVDRKIFKDTTNYSFELKKLDTGQLQQYEKTLLEGLFKDTNLAIGSIVELTSLKSDYYTTIDSAKETLKHRLIADGYFKGDPAKAGLILWIIVGISFALLIILAATLGVGIVLGLIVSLPIVAAFAFAMPARTLAGVQAKEHALGLKLYLQVVEKDRIVAMQSPNAPLAANANQPVRTVELFEKLLPYAIVFGVEKQWADEFKDIYKQPPGWYGGNLNTFSTIYLASVIGGALSTGMATAFAAPSSSGSSGFGGGFSGGGGGGGGGGGW